MRDDRRTFSTLHQSQMLLRDVWYALPTEGPGITVNALCEELRPSWGVVGHERVGFVLRYFRSTGNAEEDDVFRWRRTPGGGK